MMGWIERIGGWGGDGRGRVRVSTSYSFKVGVRGFKNKRYIIYISERDFRVGVSLIRRYNRHMFLIKVVFFV